MVIDAAKGIEARTRKLFEVCRLRDIPIITFINKMDRESRDTFDLLDEIEAQFVANDLTCDQDDGRTIAIGLEYPVDEMQASGAAAACDCRQAIRHLRFRLRGKRSRFFMSHRHPLDFAFFE